ncbi:hypothetical protein QF39_003052 [Salmonella enterica subsp. enterica]|uniref:Uncharacterized protein n=2 Tax=Salmonella enterica I TaxID=59201 RepID=A0A3Q9MMR3_SALET|nr:hypothetical protein ELZ88_06185 [Salmonella enterica subsp. enterica serovar Karamoja]EAN9048746.1 hypothetical protein [Salmonella enterica]EAW1736807.1 hypothetical protein [Salmonella enterica subsp. enterica]EBG3171283.1 hypothetical protein [Salmonella enterica subsp. enterica serovar Thetford]EBS3371113.1 hypothetical protein [Salmonella enterica subsp. enterica serovar Millesi]EBX7684903.1 hypothetical protein [Salmonella enterica subsp. enterica serovar Jubilee]EBY1553218.1 hypoth
MLIKHKIKIRREINGKKYSIGQGVSVGFCSEIKMLLGYSANDEMGISVQIVRCSASVDL